MTVAMLDAGALCYGRFLLQFSLYYSDFLWLYCRTRLFSAINSINALSTAHINVLSTLLPGKNALSTLYLS